MVGNQIEEHSAISAYSQWIHRWFDHDASALSVAYSAEH
jgi:hypothetical protein